MAFISASEGFVKKTTTSVENKFISKYLPAIEPVAAKVYLYSLYLLQNNISCEFSDLAQILSIDEDKLKEYFTYLDECELIKIVSFAPFEVKMLGAENLSGTPKRFRADKYADFTRSVQDIIKGRMISTNEFREYFLLVEEYGFEQNALIMIINYCVQMKGDNIRLAYIKKVAKSFADNGDITTKKVDERLSAFTSSTPALIKIFTAANIKKQPDIEDGKLYKIWVNWGFDETMMIEAAKRSAAKTNPVKVMNELLTYWKDCGVFTLHDIPLEMPKTSQYKRENKKSNILEKWQSVMEEINEQNNDEVDL